MSLSGDEDDFQSADEDIEDTPKSNVDSFKVSIADLNKQDQVQVEAKDDRKVSKLKPTSFSDKSELINDAFKDESKDRNRKLSMPDCDETVTKTFNLTEVRSSTSSIELDDEDALAERIRERNLKLARKYSAEIAKNVKPSEPIPAQRVGLKIDDIEYPNNIQDSELDSPLPLPPPAPPSTPALSSSYNSEETLNSPTSTNSSGTQYGWRIPAKMKTNQQAESTSEDKLKASQQARDALDRLSEQLSQSDKNLFEKIAEDVKKVAIKAGDHISPGSQTSPSTSSQGGGTNIPLISDLGSSLGGWSWNSASKFLASATQVTSQVGSVLADSVVNVGQHLQQTDQTSVVRQQAKEDESKTKQGDIKKQGSINVAGTSQSENNQPKPTMSTSEAASNDALVDFTLNAMESLGKKAFEVMTERDDSGSLQIKGIGRPWDHLLSRKVGQQQILENTESAEYKQTADEPEIITSSDTGGKKIEQEKEEKTTLKNRKRRLDYSDNDKLD